MSATDALASEIAEILIPRLVAVLDSRSIAVVGASPPQAAPVLITEGRYSKRYGISPRTLQDWRRKGRASPAFIRLGRKILYIDSMPSS